MKLYKSATPIYATPIWFPPKREHQPSNAFVPPALGIAARNASGYVVGWESALVLAWGRDLRVHCAQGR